MTGECTGNLVLVVYAIHCICVVVPLINTCRAPVVQELTLHALYTCICTDLFGGGAGPSEEDQGAVTISDAVTNDVLRPLARDAGVQQELESQLPPDQPANDVLVSPQFQQAMDVFSAALSSGQLGPLMSQFGLSTDVATAAATGGTLYATLDLF